MQPDYKGVAHGALALTADGERGAYVAFAGYGSVGWALGLDQAGTVGPLEGATPAAKIISYSYTSDTSGLPMFDAFATQFGVLSSMGAGNNGPGLGSTDCGAHNALCVGAIDPVTIADHTDDVMADFSGRGPTPDGRKKPDLVAVGVTVAARSTFASSGLGLWRAVSGTSYSTPQVAGAAALLMGAGITDPMAIRALLIDSARQGRASAPQAMDTQTGWQPDWGWGELDLTQAYAERSNLRASTVKPGQPRFFTGTTQAAKDRATLVWNRRATTSLTNTIPQNWNTTASALTNLDLVERATTDCSVRTSSASGVDNVEQTRSPGAANVTYVVRSQSTAVDGREDEPFVLASTRATTQLTTPVPQLETTLSPAALKGGDEATLSVTATNPSGDMDAAELRVTPQLPDGLELIAGSPTQSASDFPAGAVRTFTWTVRATGDGQRIAQVRAETSACGEAVTSSAQASVTVDSSGPAASISAPAGSSQAGPVPVSWIASDSSGVASYDVEVSVSGGPFQPWLTSTVATSAAYTTGAGLVYAWRVRGRDALGHIGAWVTSETLTIVSSPPAPTTAPPPAGPSAASRLKITKFSRATKPVRVLVSGTVANGARGGVYITVRLWSRRTRKTVTAITTARSGRWKAALRVPARHARFSRAEATARYDADFTYVGGLARRSLRLR